MESNDKQDNDFNEPVLEPIQKTIKPIVAGITLFIVAAFVIFVCVGFILLDEQMIEYQRDTNPQFNETFTILNMTTEQFISYFSTCGTIGIVMSIFIILSGVLALKRRFWGIVLVGAIVGIVTFFITVFSGILAIIPLILLIMSRKEFT